MLRLIPPGKRKGNRFYIIRGRFEGHTVDKTTKTTDELVAKRIKLEIESRILNSGTPEINSRVTFHRAADLYKQAKRPTQQYVNRIERLKTAIAAGKLVSDIRQGDLDLAAQQLYPDNTPESRNTNVFTPAIAIINYATENDWCPPRKFKRPKIKRPETRAASDAAASALISATTGKKRLLLAWLFYHGTRISGALTVDCAKINLQAKTYDLYISKIREWRTFPIAPQVAALLQIDPDAQRGHGRLFPWGRRDRVYEWLAPLTKQLGVSFTPHMARHWLGKKIGNSHGLRAAMAALGQSSYQSAIRYVSEDADLVRQAQDRLKIDAPADGPPIIDQLGNVLGKTKKRR